MAFDVGSTLKWLQDFPGVCVALILVVVCTLYLFCRTRKKLPPGPTPWPILGSFVQIAKAGGTKMHLFFKSLYEKYGPVAQIYFGGYPFVSISGYDAVNNVFVKQRDVMLGRPDFVPGIKAIKLFSQGIPFSNGTPWAESRKTMLSAVSVVLNSPRHEDLVLKEVQKLVKVFTDKEGAVFQPKEHLIQASLAWHLAMVTGKRYARDDAIYQRILKAFIDILHSDGSLSPFGTIPLLKYIPCINKRYKKNIAAFNDMGSATRSELDDLKSSYDENRIHCVMDVYIKEQRHNPDNPTFSDDQIAVYAANYLVGGMMPVAFTLDWALLYMAAYPEIQEKCRQEIQQVCGKEDQVRVFHTDKLPYVRATVFETQRMATVVSHSIPYCALKDITVNGYTIPQGTMIAGNLASVHMDDTQWTEPDKFNPDRFLDMHGKLAKTPPGFMPFGNGPRMCPGYYIPEKELFLVFANLIHSMEFTSSGKVNFDAINPPGTRPASNEIIAKKRQ